MGIRRRARKHKAGVDYAEETYEFQVGDRVLTIEGILGTVIAVEDGPYAGSEQYIVELDADLGGGDYMASELSLPDDVKEASMSGHSPKGDFRNSDEKTAQKTAKTATLTVEVVLEAPTNENFFKAVEDKLGLAHGDVAIHGVNRLNSYYVISDDKDLAAYEVTYSLVRQAQAQPELEAADLADDEDIYSLASDDYPELAEILDERPPLPHSERLGSKTGLRIQPKYQGDYSGDECEYCGKPIKDIEKAQWVEKDLSGALVMGEFLDESESMGAFPIGPDCYRRLEAMAPKTAARTLTFTHPRTGEVFTRSTDADYTHVSFDNRNQIAWHTSEEIARRRSSNYFPIQQSSSPSRTRSEPEPSTEYPTRLTDAGRHECHVCEGTGKLRSRNATGGYTETTCHLCGGKGWIVRDSSGRVVGVKIAVKSQEGDGTFMENVAALSKEGMGWWMDKFLYPLAVDMIAAQPEDIRFDPETGRGPSFDWCRFRRARFCYFPDALDQAATDEAGYAVWIPVERGFCPREKWDGPDGQKNCPVGEPGPNADPSIARADATVSWADGGQRYDSNGNPLRPKGR